MKSDGRRKMREERYAHEAGQASSGSPELSPEAFSQVDEALAGLREKDREAIILRFFQELALEEIGRVQGTSADATRKRINRALKKLADLFQRKGIAVPSAAVATTILSESTQAAPIDLASSVAAKITIPAAPSIVSSTLTSLITLGKTNPVLIAALMAMIPLILQQLTLAELQAQHDSIKEQISKLPAQLPRPPVVAVDPMALPEDENSMFNAVIDTMMESEESMEAFAKMAQQIEETRIATRVKNLAQKLGASDEQTTAMIDHAVANLDREKQRSRKQFASLRNFQGTQEEYFKEFASEKSIEPLDGIEQFLRKEQALRLAELIKEEEEALSKKVTDMWAYEELSELQQLVQLTEEQKDSALNVFREEWNPTDREDENAPLFDPKLTPQERIDGHLEKFTDILSEEQLGVYRQHLEVEEAKLHQ